MIAVGLGCLDVFAALVMFWSALHITANFGIFTTEARWALFRRIVFGSTSIALFGLGIGRLDGEHPVTGFGEAIFQVMLVFGVVIFPVLRAYGWITQDQFRSVDGSYERGSGRPR